MRLKAVVVLSTLSLSTILGAQTTCAAKSGVLPLGPVITRNTVEHNPPVFPATAEHRITAFPTLTCTYSHGSTGTGSCDTVCAVVTTPLNPEEDGTTLTAGTTGHHDVNGSWADGSGGAFGGGLSCNAMFGGGAINCGIAEGVGCIVDLTLSASANGGGITVKPKPNQTIIWQQAPLTLVPNNCPSVSDPQVSTGGKFIPPDPCLDGPSFATLTGVTGDAINNPSCSPILIDTTGAGITLVRKEAGPKFDLRGAGVKSVVSWTGFAETSVGFLALDRNGNGTIDDGTELFGNFTAQPDSPNKNGFAALAEFDKPQNGGNSDGVISSLDAVWPKLRIWIDYNHDGISEPDELKPLSFYHIEALDLNYHEDKHVDQWGNAFRYKARVISDNSGKAGVGRWAYDVFLTVLDMHPDEHKK